MITVIDLKAALGELKTLRGRTPETPEAEREGAFAKLSQYRDGGIFAAKFSGESAWERHPNGDEIVQIVEGKTTVHLLTDDGPQSIAAGRDGDCRATEHLASVRGARRGQPRHRDAAADRASHFRDRRSAQARQAALSARPHRGFKGAGCRALTQT